MQVLHRLPESRFSRVERAWSGATVAVLGGGPSLTREQVAEVGHAHFWRRVYCIAVNDAYLLAPWADLHYAADAHWHRWHTAGIDKPLLGLTAAQVRERWHAFAGQKCTIQSSGGTVSDPNVHMLRNKTFPAHGMGLSEDPCALITGRNSGFQSVNLAVLAGAQRVLLLGFDARAGERASHWHGEHPREMPVAIYGYIKQAFTDAERALARLGVRVLNCSPGSAINTFPKYTLEEALAEEAPA